MTFEAALTFSQIVREIPQTFHHKNEFGIL